MPKISIWDEPATESVPIGAATPKILIFVDPAMVPLNPGPVGIAEPNISTSDESATVSLTAAAAPKSLISIKLWPVRTRLRLTLPLRMPKMPMSSLLMTDSRLSNGFAVPKILTFDEPLTVAFKAGPFTSAEPKISISCESLIVANVVPATAVPNTVDVNFPPLTLVKSSIPLPKMSTLLLSATVIRVPGVEVPKIPTSFESKTEMVVTALFAEPKASIDWPVPPLVA